MGNKKRKSNFTEEKEAPKEQKMTQAQAQTQSQTQAQAQAQGLYQKTCYIDLR